jgi:PAS domain S-box-containing protein
MLARTEQRDEQPDTRIGGDLQRAHDSLLSAVLESATDCVFVIDTRGMVVELNPAAERTFGYRRKEILGRELATLVVPPSLRERYRQAVRGLRDGESASLVDRRMEFTGMRSDGSEFPVELTVTSVAHEPALFAGFVRDATEQRKVIEGKDLLAAAGAAFDSSLDPQQTMRTIARMAIPQLAELCVIDLIRADGLLGDSVAAAGDERLARRLEDLRAREPLFPGGDHPVARALRSREPVVVQNRGTSEALEQVAQSAEYRRLSERAGYRSAVVIRLAARGRLLGALSFLSTTSDDGPDAGRLALMQDLAGRAAMALDNANLYAERARVAQTLQHSLLPDALPTVVGLQLASVYRPVDEGSEAGGDFYDVFQAPSGCWLAVGDVCGKGTEAAAVTAMVRHSIRALAIQQPSPAEVLRTVNDVMLSHDLSGRFATAILARLDLSRETPRAVLASAGHPAPVLLEEEGEARCIEVNGPLLGVVADLRPREREVELSPGATLVLYTDGLTDAGAPGCELTPEDLCRHLADQAGCPPRVLVKHLEELAVSRGRVKLRDDIAILAARIKP